MVYEYTLQVTWDGGLCAYKGPEVDKTPTLVSSKNFSVKRFCFLVRPFPGYRHAASSKAASLAR